LAAAHQLFASAQSKCAKCAVLAPGDVRHGVCKFPAGRAVTTTRHHRHPESIQRGASEGALDPAQRHMEKYEFPGCIILCGVWQPA